MASASYRSLHILVSLPWNPRRIHYMLQTYPGKRTYGHYAWQSSLYFLKFQDYMEHVSSLSPHDMFLDSGLMWMKHVSHPFFMLHILMSDIFMTIKPVTITCVMILYLSSKCRWNMCNELFLPRKNMPVHEPCFLYSHKHMLPFKHILYLTCFAAI